MKCTVDRRSLIEGLKRAAAVLESRTVRPEHTCLRLAVKGGALEVVGQGRESIVVFTTRDVDARAEGAVIVKPDELLALLTAVVTPTVDLAGEDVPGGSELVISADGDRYRFAGWADDGWVFAKDPEDADVTVKGQARVSIQAKAFHAMLDAASAVQLRGSFGEYALEAMRIEITQGVVTVVAINPTTGVHVCAKVRSGPELGGEAEVMITPEVLPALRGLLNSVPPPEAGEELAEVVFTCGPAWWRVDVPLHVGSVVMYGPAVAGRYSAWRDLFKGTPRWLWFDGARLAKAVERASIFRDELGRVCLTMRPDGVTVVGSNATGVARTTLVCTSSDAGQPAKLPPFLASGRVLGSLIRGAGPVAMGIDARKNLRAMVSPPPEVAAWVSKAEAVMTVVPAPEVHETGPESKDASAEEVSVGE